MQHVQAAVYAAAAATALTASAAVAQGTTPATAASAVTATTPAAVVPRPRLASMLDQSATPATVSLNGGKLSIEATNSSLRAILGILETRTGTKVEGLNHDVRIFGVYGPGNPQEVLAALLDDSGYNILISGRKADGSPREIVLSPHVQNASAQSAGGATRTQAGDEDDEIDADSPPVPAPALSAPVQPTPVAAPGAPGQVKTPQQMLDELQRMRQTTTGGATQPPPQ